ncbi:DUF5684 domain-containing protein [Pseudanabaena sp. PCC 6802]|uniref:DUF5684 domain-containing protein n=1 Tax=Pseudanabaena sp. PCC 6802 TaxID=118173 RepID=UPI00034AACB6|nr:DUF5684 domain-containing protein [Pseudanabaena sp. PCC 6802]
MNFVKYLGFRHVDVVYRRISLFLISLFAVIGLQHFVAEPILSAPGSISNAIAPSASIALITHFNEQIVAQDSTQDNTSSENNPTTAPLTEEQKALADKILLFSGVIGLLAYLFVSFCLMKIAEKLSIPNSWLAWVPIAQIWVMIRAAGKPGWWLILLFVPLVNFVIGLIVLFSIPPNLGKSSLLGLLIFLPVLGVFLYWGLLAFT